jgi:hypothetical protein
MPNRRTKDVMKSAKQAAARQRDKASRLDELEKESARLRAKAAEDHLAGAPSIVASLPEASVRERKLQSENKDAPSLSGELKGRVLSKHEILARRKNVAIPEKIV